MRRNVPWRRILKIILVGAAVVILSVLGYRYYNRPLQSWQAQDFEGRNPNHVAVKAQGQTFWTGKNQGEGFYITDSNVAVGSVQRYCLSGGVTSETLQYHLGGQQASAANGFFTSCFRLKVDDRKRITFSIDSGSAQIYRIERKR